MISIHPSTAADIPSASQLSAAAGWNQTTEDWNRFLRMEPAGCFLAKRDDRIVGTVVTCRFGHVAWVGMMLVDAACRSQGIGRQLIECALAYLDGIGVRSVRLDATDLGAPLYESMGFSAQYAVRRYSGDPIAKAGANRPEEVRRLSENDVERVMKLDQSIIGCDRRPMLTALWNEEKNACWVHESDGALRGYICDRPGRLARFVGPCVSADVMSGRDLLDASLARFSGETVFVDVVVPNEHAVQVVEASGLAPAREFVRMTRGEPSIEELSGLYASSGPEKG